MALFPFKLKAFYSDLNCLVELTFESSTEKKDLEDVSFLLHFNQMTRKNVKYTSSYEDNLHIIVVVIVFCLFVCSFNTNDIDEGCTLEKNTHKKE